MIIGKLMYAWTIVLLTFMVICKKDDVSIIFVSSSENSGDRPVYSSLRGGTKIRIKAVGHELDERLNQVLVGTFPCKIPSGGVTNAFITCETTDSKSTTDIYNLRVTLISDGRTAVSSVNDVVHYTNSATPKITEVFPSSTYGGSTVAIQGNHNTNTIGDEKDTGNLKELELGDKQCNMEGVKQDKYSPGNGNSYIKCRETDEKQAGEYKVTEKVDKGEADHDQGLERASLDGRSYQYTYLPTVREISDHQGDQEGQIITIKGSGFSKRPENNSVTVDGNPCEIIEVDYKEIKCRLAPRNHSLSSKLSCNASSYNSVNSTNSSNTTNSTNSTNTTTSNYTNSSNVSAQQNGYHAGTGINYQRHQNIYDLQSYIINVRAGTIGTAVQSTVKTQLREPALYNYASGQNWKGYFVAPASGLYVFRGIAGGYFSMFFADVSGTTKLTTHPFIYSNQEMGMWDNFYYDDVETAERNVSLIEGESYYFEIYHQYYSPAFFKLIVDVPNDNTKLKYQSYQVQKLVLNATVQSQQILYSMIGATKGYLNLRITRYNSKGVKIYNVNVTIPYNCSEYQFLNAMYQFDNFANYMPSVVKEYYDSDDNKMISNFSSAYKINYIVSLFLNRSSTLQKQNFIVSKLNYTGSFTKTILRQHSPLITGTFSISIGGWNLEKKGMNFDISASTLQSYIRQLPGFQKVEVAKTTIYGCSYWCTWIINYKDVFMPIPLIQIDNSDITGGVGDAAFSLHIRRPYSSRITFQPIDHQFLRRPSSAPSVIVESNNLTSVCVGNCSYKFRNISTIASYTYNAPNLELLLEGGLNNSFPLKNITVKLGDLPCTLDQNSTLPTIKCSLKKDSVGNVPLRCGLAKLEVQIIPFGFMKLKGGLSHVFIPLNTHGLHSISGGVNGGTINKIYGAGFTEDIEQIEIIICNQSATIISSTLYLITFYMPACSLGGGNQSVHLSIGDCHNSSLTYSYVSTIVSPTIYSINPPSFNPAVKGVLQISGTGFGQNITEIEVFLANATGKIYRLKVLSLNNSYLKVGVSGGLPGVYTVEVSLSNSAGNSVPAINGSNIFEYKLQVVSVYPKTGSLFGGTLITITGVNFSPVEGQTHVYVGPALNWFCKIENITTNSIQCRTPIINSNYEINKTLQVVTSTKIYMISKCSTNDCYFSYMDMASSPSLTAISATSISQNYLLFLNGTNFLIDAFGCSVVMTNLLNDSLTFTLNTLNATNNATSFYVTLNIPGGDYLVKIRTSIGDSNPLLLKVDWVIGTPNITTGSSQGYVVSFTGGSGYPAALSTTTYLTLTSADLSTYYDFKVISCCSNNNLVIEISPQSTGSTLALSFKSNNFTKVQYLYTSSSSTPNINLTTSKMMNQGLNTISIIRTDSVKGYRISEITLVSSINPLKIVNISNLTTTDYISYNFTASLASGSYKIRAKTPLGYCTVNSSIYVNLPSNISLPYQQFSYAGGEIKLTGSLLSPSSYLTVGGVKAEIKEYNSSFVTYAVPPLVSNASQYKYSLVPKSKKIDPKYFTIFGESAVTNASAAFDDSTRTIFGSSLAVCYFGVDAGAGLSIVLDMVRFFPIIDWVSVYGYLEGAVFQTSQNGLNWTLLYSIDQNVHTGWNAFRLANQTGSRYVRFRHTSKSRCNLAEIQLYGYVISELDFSTVNYYDGYNSQTFSNAIEPRDDRTPVVNKIQPPYGDIFGGYIIRLIGENLNFSTASIIIDEVPCAIMSSNTTYLQCQVGARPKIPKQNTFFVKVGTLNAVIRAKFLYVLKWSDDRTWGVDMPPIDGDLVYVPPGLTLLIDQNTPDLIGITVANGTIIIPNNTDISIKGGFLTMVGGNFIAGTEEQPFYGNLQITLTGGYYGKQQPLFGNKVLGCLDCRLSLYGRPRLTWTTLSKPILAGESFLTLSAPNDWAVGEEIVVSSTSFDHYESQRRKIISVINGTIFVDLPFKYAHSSEVKQYSNDTFTIRAEVGLLTRNIKVKGDEETLITDYGAHILVSATSPGALEADIAYTEFTRCGQQKIPGRNCLRFTNTKQVPSSIVRGNSIYDSNSRLISLNDVSFLTVENNVGYRVKGHNIYFQSGTESNNNIKSNLIISSLRADGMLQSDFTVSSIWVTNPGNNIEDNHLAGGDYYGIFYNLQDKTTGVSDICPSGTALGRSNGNYIHSFAQQGLRITELIPRKFPCASPRNTNNPDDQWLFNPSVPTIFSNYVLYRNGNEGVLIQQVGNLIFDGFLVADNAVSGINIQVANFTKQMVGVRNSIIIGQLSNITSPSATARGILTPRTGQSNISNVRFYNFSTTSFALATCSGCDYGTYMTNLGNQVYIQKTKFSSIDGVIMSMLGVRRDVIVDLDGSLSSYFFNTSIPSGTLVWGYNHIANRHSSACHRAIKPQKWDGIIMCNPSITIRRIFFTNAIGASYYWSFYWVGMSVLPIDSIDEIKNSSNTNSNWITTIDNTYPIIQKQSAWSLPYVTGQIYQVQWGAGNDFNHISISTAPNYAQTDLGIVFKMPYTMNRELYSVGPLRGYVFPTTSQLVQEGIVNPSPANCSNGEYRHVNDEGPARMLAVCQSGKNKTKYEYTEINAIYCKYVCPTPPVPYVPSSAGTIIRQNFVRRWSNATQWPNGTIPGPGDDVFINGNWTVLLDMDPRPANFMVIDGTLIADDSRDIRIPAKAIHIRAGNVSIGSANNPFNHKFTIELLGSQSDPPMQFGSDLSGSKMLVVSGILNLFGTPPYVPFSYLGDTALKGQKLINVASNMGWNAGDRIGLSPSFGKYNEFQEVTIAAINLDSTINLTQPLTYTHYGSPQAMSTIHGEIDLNTYVSHLSRNIQIIGGNSSNWGSSVIIYGYYDIQVHRVGVVKFYGVQLIGGGQRDKWAGLQFLNLMDGSSSTTIQFSSMHDCKGVCVGSMNSNGLSFSSNNIFESLGSGISLLNTRQSIFSNNLIIGISSGACVEIEDSVGLEYALTVKDNFCLGSAHIGYHLSLIGCQSLEENYFGNNTAGSCGLGYLLKGIDTSDKCQGFSYLRAYACRVGQSANPMYTSELIYQHFILVDNIRGASLNFGDDEDKVEHIGRLEYSFISALSRPTCSYCYGQNATKCSDLLALQMLSVSGNGQDEISPNIEIINSAEVFDSKAYLQNVIFQNYRATFATFPQCGNSFVLRPNPLAHDAIAIHSLFDCQCVGCDTDSYIFADAPDQTQVGPLNGCGGMVCTGRSNYLVVDFNGTFLTQKGLILPSNQIIGQNEDFCTYSSRMNAHVCLRSDLAVMAYQSIASDYNSREVWPVTLAYDGSNYTTTTNAWRQWQWQGKTPRNRRLGRFLSIVKLGVVYNITFKSMPPVKLQFQLQQKQPQPTTNGSVVMKIHYPLPNMIRIYGNGKIMDPILITDSGVMRELNLSKCGDNIYFYTNYTSHFVVSQKNCKVKLQLVDSVQLTTHFVMKPEEFFQTSVMSSYINNLCALLNIADTSRIKIVGVYSGSTVVQTIILPSSMIDNSTNSTNTSASGNVTADAAQMSAIQQQVNLLIQNGSYSTSMQTTVGYVVLQSSSTLALVDPPAKATKEQISEETQNIAIFVAIGIGAAVILIIILVICFNKKAAASRNQVEEQPAEDFKEYGEVLPVPSDSIIFSNEAEAPKQIKYKITNNMRKNRRRANKNNVGLEIKQNNPIQHEEFNYQF